MTGDPTLVLALVFVAIAAIAYFVFASFAYGAGYQPTPRRSVEKMLRLAEVGPKDIVYDLGAGTGAIVFRAARIYRARVVGVEVEPIRAAILRIRRATGPMADRITVHWGNFFELNFREATVVTAFLWSGAMVRLRPKLEAELPPGARVVSHCHEIVGWVPEVYDPVTDVYFYRRPGSTTEGGVPTPVTGGT
jgi:ribosomal protein L11 methylase PrmA